MPRPLLLLLAWLAVAALRADPPAPASPTGPVALTGSNGRAAEFAGIWEARPAGLAVVVTADSPLAIVPWT